MWSLLLPSLSDLCTLRWRLIGPPPLALRSCGCGLQLGVTGIKTLQQFPSNTVGFILHDLIDLGEGREGWEIQKMSCNVLKHEDFEINFEYFTGIQYSIA